MKFKFASLPLMVAIPAVEMNYILSQLESIDDRLFLWSSSLSGASADDDDAAAVEEIREALGVVVRRFHFALQREDSSCDASTPQPPPTTPPPYVDRRESLDSASIVKRSLPSSPSSTDSGCDAVTATPPPQSWDGFVPLIDDTNSTPFIHEPEGEVSRNQAVETSNEDCANDSLLLGVVKRPVSLVLSIEGLDVSRSDLKATLANLGVPEAPVTFFGPKTIIFSVSFLKAREFLMDPNRIVDLAGSRLRLDLSFQLTYLKVVAVPTRGSLINLHPRDVAAMIPPEIGLVRVRRSADTLCFVFLDHWLARCFLEHPPPFLTLCRLSLDIDLSLQCRTHRPCPVFPVNFVICHLADVVPPSAEELWAMFIDNGFDVFFLSFYEDPRFGLVCFNDVRSAMKLLDGTVRRRDGAVIVSASPSTVNRWYYDPVFQKLNPV